MKCPMDSTPLQMTERKGVEIDYCPQCRGVWLDRGELDKIIEHGAERPGNHPTPPPPPHHAPPVHQHYKPDYHQKDYRHHDDHKYHHKKKESFLSEIFDF